MEASTVFFLALLFTQWLTSRVLDLSPALHQLTVSPQTAVLTLLGLFSPWCHGVGGSIIRFLTLTSPLIPSLWSQRLLLSKLCPSCLPPIRPGAWKRAWPGAESEGMLLRGSRGPVPVHELGSGASPLTHGAALPRH